MKQFMEPQELARDRRFKRTKSRNTLLRSLPDDVEGIVRIFESIAEKIRERVAETSLEAVYDDLGPGFQFLTASGGRQPKDERTPLQLRLQLHGIFRRRNPSPRGRRANPLGLSRFTLGFHQGYGQAMLGRSAPRSSL